MEEMKKIQLIIEKETGLELNSPIRDRQHVYARTIYFKLCRERTHKTLKQIGESINKNHATVIHALKNVCPMLLQYEPAFEKTYTKIKSDEDLEPIELRYEKLQSKYDVLYDLLKDQIDTLPNKAKKLISSEAK